MTDGGLEGTWRVRRLGGLLPPMVGVRKRISGRRGETAIGGLPGMRFDVVGNELRYRPPLTFVVDRLDRVESEWVGVTFVGGRAVGRFSLERQR